MTGTVGWTGLVLSATSVGKWGGDKTLIFFIYVDYTDTSVLIARYNLRLVCAHLFLIVIAVLDKIYIQYCCSPPSFQFN